MNNLNPDLQQVAETIVTENQESDRKILTTKEAYAIAVSRGFTGKEKSLTDKVTRNPKEIEIKYSLVRLEGGRNAKWLDKK